MAHKHLKNSTLPPNMQEAAQLIAWAIQRMLKFVPPEERSDTIRGNTEHTCESASQRSEGRRFEGKHSH